MAQVTTLQIMCWYRSATGKHGDHPAARDITRGLLEDIASQSVNYSRKSEREATEAEEAIALLDGEDIES